MALLPEYLNFQEKANFFKLGANRYVINVDKVLQHLDDLYNNGDFIFRGCTEAKYKLFNSAQRYYITNELYQQVPPEKTYEHYDKFISNLIEECKVWNRETVQKLLLKSKIHEDNALAYLSYMQHFGIPSPFLDFTLDPYVALYFAIDNISSYPSNNEIDNYFSIYFTYQNSTVFDSWKHVSGKKFDTTTSQKLTYDQFTWHTMHLLLPDNEAYQLLNNTNIINQKGLFLYNRDHFKPIEETYIDYIKFVKANLKPEVFKDALIEEHFSYCYNIHKSLTPYIREILNSKGITKEYIYPDNYKMRNTVLHNATIKALKIN